MKNKNTKKKNPTFPKKKKKKIGTECRLTYTHTEQNNDHARIIHKIQFRSSFNYLIVFTCWEICVL